MYTYVHSNLGVILSPSELNESLWRSTSPEDALKGVVDGFEFVGTNFDTVVVNTYPTVLTFDV